MSDRPRDFEGLFTRISDARATRPGKAEGPRPVPGHKTPDRHPAITGDGDKVLVILAFNDKGGAFEYNGTTSGVYITLNPVNPTLLARAINHTINYAMHTTGDADIVRRRWIPIYLDPVRPTSVSSTDIKHQAGTRSQTEPRDVRMNNTSHLQDTLNLYDSGKFFPIEVIATRAYRGDGEPFDVAAWLIPFSAWARRIMAVMG